MNKFEKYNLTGAKKMFEIKAKEDKETLRTLPGYSKAAYTGIYTRVSNLNLTESVDRRIVFELLGLKIGTDFKEECLESESEEEGDWVSPTLALRPNIN